MSLSIRTLWCTVGAVGLAALVPLAWHRVQTSREAQTQTRRLEGLTAQAQSLGTLYANLPEWAATDPTKPAGPLAPQVSAALTASGLPASAMASLSAESGPPASGGASTGIGGSGIQIQRKRATLVLASITLPQLGAFLQTWRQRQPVWTVSQIEVSPDLGAAVKGNVAATGGDLPLRAVLALESLSLEQPRGVR